MAATLVLAVGGLTGCTGGSRSGARSRSRDEIFLAAGPNRLRALQLTVDNQRVDGTLTLEDVLPSDPTHEQVRAVNLGGSERNGHLSLQPVGTSGRWTGEKTGDTVVLRYRLADSTPATDSLVRSSRSAFDRATGALSEQVAAAGQQVAAARQAAQAAEGLARAQALADSGQVAAAARLRRQAEAQARAAFGRASAAAAASGRASAAIAARGRAAAAIAATNRARKKH